MKKIADLHYQGEVFTIETDGADFAVLHGGDLVGLGYWSIESDRLRWQERPRETPTMPCDSGTMRALEYVVLENLRPFCESCCEQLKTADSEYCWPCVQSFRAECA